MDEVRREASCGNNFISYCRWAHPNVNETAPKCSECEKSC